MSLKLRAEVLTLKDLCERLGGVLRLTALGGWELVDLVADHLLGHEERGGEGVSLDFLYVAGHAGGLVAQVDPDRDVEDELTARVERPVAELVGDRESLPR
jgi:hypothetical protein